MSVQPPDSPDLSADALPEYDLREMQALGALVAALRKCTDLQSVCFELATRSADLAGLDDCVIYVRHGNLLVQTASCSTQVSADPEDPAVSRTQSLPLDRIALPLGSGVVGRAAVRRMPVYVADLSLGGASVAGSEYALPLIHNGELVGVINSQSMLAHGFDMRCRVLVRAAADISASVIASYRNLEAGTSANALTDVVAELAALPKFGSENYEEGIALLVERAATVLQVSYVSVWLREGSGLQLVDRYGLTEQRHVEAAIPDADGLAWFLGEGQEPGVLVIGDTLHDTRARHLVSSDIEGQSVVSSIHAPIRSAGELHGVLCLDVCEARRQWTEAEVSFAGAIADVAALGLIAAQKSKAELALVQAQRLESLGQLAGGVAHDFNNLLTVINGGVSLLQQRQAEEPGTQTSMAATEDKRLLEMIETAGQRAQKLTRQLLAFGKKQRLSLQLLDVGALLERSLDVGRGVIREDIQVTLSLPEQPCWVEGDAEQLDQTLLNLLMNAIDAMPLGGCLRLSVRVDETDVICRIEDSGAGVPEPLRHRIFEPFYTTKGDGGTGLGLAVSYGIVKQHGGDLRLRESNHPKYGGAAFEICLPVKAAPVFASGDIRVTEPNAVNQIGGKVLLVEDEQDVRFVVERMLTRLGFEAVVASDAGEALRLLDERNIEVLVTDVVMPDLRGPELYALALKRRPDLRVLFMSGYSESSLVDVPEDSAGVRYLSKPFTLPALEGALYELFQIESERSPIVVESLLTRD